VRQWWVPAGRHLGRATADRADRVLGERLRRLVHVDRRDHDHYADDQHDLHVRRLLLVRLLRLLRALVLGRCLVERLVGLGLLGFRLWFGRGLVELRRHERIRRQRHTGRHQHLGWQLHHRQRRRGPRHLGVLPAEPRRLLAAPAPSA
jgi:hypothetical protein